MANVPPPPPPNVFKELDDMIDFELDFDIGKIVDKAMKDVDIEIQEVQTEMEQMKNELLADVRGRMHHKEYRGVSGEGNRAESDVGREAYISASRYQTPPSSPLNNDNLTVDGEPTERLEDQMDEWREKLSRWLHSNSGLSISDIEDMSNVELLQVSQVLYEYSLSNGEFKKGARGAVIKRWFEVKAARASVRIQQKDNHTEQMLKIIKNDWRYRIKEIVQGNGGHAFIPQRRSKWTFGLYWESASEVYNLKNAVSIVERWLKADIKEQVIIHGESPKTVRGDRNEIIKGLRSRHMEAAKGVRLDGPPRKRPPPPPMPPMPRTIKEDVPNPFEIEIPPEPVMPPNESVGIDFADNGYRPTGPYAGPNPYTDRSMTPEQEERFAEDEEKSTIVELKSNLLD